MCKGVKKLGKRTKPQLSEYVKVVKNNNNNNYVLLK